jgi:hypothetical protein
LNAIDIAIFVAIVCSVVLLLFSDNIISFIGTDEISMIDVTLKIENATSARSGLVSEGKSVVFEPENSTEIKADALVKKPIEPSDSNEDASSEFVITCTGYKKFGRFFTENGDRIAVGRVCTATIDGETITCIVTSAKIAQ